MSIDGTHECACGRICDGPRQLSLEEVIEQLERCVGNASVHLENGDGILGLHSWRGRYDELSLDPHPGTAGIEVKELIMKLRAAASGAVGFQGYKGGEFRMQRHTPVWADGYGECDGNAVVAILSCGRRAIVKVVKRDD